MDTSEQYIKMCRASREVQELWENKSDFEVPPDIMHITQWAYRCEKCQIWDSYASWIAMPSGEVVLDDGPYCRGCGKKTKPAKNVEYIESTFYGSIEDLSEGGKESVWLPRQDQLQEMIPELFAEPQWCDLNKLDEFIHFIWNRNPRYNISMEAMWFAFVMHDKYDKIWDGEKWRLNADGVVDKNTSKCT